MKQTLIHFERNRRKISHNNRYDGEYFSSFLFYGEITTFALELFCFEEIKVMSFGDYYSYSQSNLFLVPSVMF